MRRIGMLSGLATDNPEGQARFAAFAQGLQQLGWTDGRNVRIDIRSAAGNVDDARKYAAELVALAPRRSGAGLRKSYPLRYPPSTISLFLAEIAAAPMMHGREKSDLAIVAVKPANKAKEAHCGGICGGGRSGVGGAKGGGQGECAPAKHVLGSEPGSRDKGALGVSPAYAAFPRRYRRARGRAKSSQCADAQGRRADRRDWHLPPGGSAVHWTSRLS